MAAGQQGPCPQPAPGARSAHFSARALAPRTPAALKGPLFLQGPWLSEKAAVRTVAPSPLPPRLEQRDHQRNGEATGVLQGPALLKGPVLEETHNPWSVRKGKQKAGLVSFLPSRHFLLLSAIPTSAAKTRDSPRPHKHHATLRSHGSSSLLPAPAQMAEALRCLSSLRAEVPGEPGPGGP